MKLILILFMLLCALSAFADAWMDDFEREKIGEDWTPAIWWKDGNNPDWKIVDGIVKGQIPKFNMQFLFLKEYDSLDYTIQVKCKIDKIWQMPEAASAGIIFRSSGLKEGVDPFYTWVIGSSFAAFIVADNANKWTFRATTREDHIIDNWYDIKLIVKDRQFIGFVDGKAVSHLESGLYNGYFVGLALGSNINASFDDFMITDSVDEDALTDFAVSTQGRIASKWGEMKQR